MLSEESWRLRPCFKGIYIIAGDSLALHPASPPFWMSLEVFIDRNPPLRAIQAYMENSCSQGLDITLKRAKSEDEDICESCVAAVVQLLNPHVKRWRKLTIEAVHLGTIRAALLGCSGTASSLEELHISCAPTECSDDRAYHSLWTELEVPNVSKLSLGG